MGIEFSYAAETAFVSPQLLKIGVKHEHMTLVWALSPLFGFFLTPVLGSLSDKCKLALGRRRPFIILFAIGVLLGLILVPNGENLGYALGDFQSAGVHNNSDLSTHSFTALARPEQNVTTTEHLKCTNYNPWGVFFTVLGTILLDFDADACQSPCRAYLLDVTVPEDHAKGLSTFTVMAGLGGFLGYAMGGINWDVTALGTFLGGHVRAVFTLTTVLFIVCVTFTVTSFKEIPLSLLECTEQFVMKVHEIEEDTLVSPVNETTYGSLDTKVYQGDSADQTDGYVNYGCEEISHPRPSLCIDPNVSLTTYLKSIIFMPHSLKMICLTNLFCWMAHVCYSLYFTDFVGEAVFGGNPMDSAETENRQLYEEGIRFGCWGMSMYSLSCACYSLIIEHLIRRYKAKRIYVGGLLIYSTGMLLMAIAKNRFGVIIFSWTAGIMYSTLFTMPYLLIAQYHARGIFENNKQDEARVTAQVRGLGTDIALASSMVFLAQFILSLCMGSIVVYTGTTTAVVFVASFLSFCGALCATQVMYLDM